MAMFSARFTDDDLRAIVLIIGEDPAAVTAAVHAYAPEQVHTATYTESPGTKLIVRAGGPEVLHYCLPRLAFFGLVSGALVELAISGTITGIGMVAGAWSAATGKFILRYFPF